LTQALLWVVLAIITTTLTCSSLSGRSLNQGVAMKSHALKKELQCEKSGSNQSRPQIPLEGHGSADMSSVSSTPPTEEKDLQSAEIKHHDTLNTHDETNKSLGGGEGTKVAEKEKRRKKKKKGKGGCGNKKEDKESRPKTADESGQKTKQSNTKEKFAQSAHLQEILEHSEAFHRKAKSPGKVTLQEVVDLEMHFQRICNRLRIVGTKLQRQWQVKSAMLQRCKDSHRQTKLSSDITHCKEKEAWYNKECGIINKEINRLHASQVWRETQIYVKQAYVQLKDGSYLRTAELEEDAEDAASFDKLYKQFNDEDTSIASVNDAPGK